MTSVGLSKNSNSKFTEINQSIINLVLDAIRENDSNLLLNFDPGQELTNLLSTLTAAQTRSLITKFSTQLINIQINHHSLGLFLHHVRTETEYDRTIDRAIRLGARYDMLNKLTGITRKEFDNRRLILNVPPPSRGRIELLSEADELKALDIWGNTAHNNPLERICIVCDQTGLAIERIWQSLKTLDFDE